MAVITQRPMVRHLRSGPTAYVQRMRRGKVVNEGVGLSFWFRPMISSISELPIDERELPLMFRSWTNDFQEVAVQATITYRIVEPAIAAGRIDFGIDTTLGSWTGTPLEQLGGLLRELAQQHAVGVLANMSLSEVLATGITDLRQAISSGLSTDDRIAETGIEIVGTRVVAVRPEADVEKALQTPIREQLQQEADRSTYERRATAVQQERAISENELQNQIELARREEELVAQQGANEKKRIADAAAASRVKTEAEADNTLVRGTAKAAAMLELGKAEAETEQLKVEAVDGVGETVLLALAAKDLAQNVPEIGTLVIAPDMIASLLAKFATGETESIPAAAAAEPRARA